MSKKKETKKNKGKKKRFKDNGAVERLLKHFFKIFSRARQKANKDSSIDDLVSNINMKLAQRLDSAGHSDLSKEVAELPARKKNFFEKLIAGFAATSMSYKLKLVGIGFASIFVMFGLTAFLLVWYRGTDVPILKNFVEQSPPVLSLKKEIETQYGVGTASDKFTIVAADTTFRSLGIVNKIDISPNVNFTAELSPDGKSLDIYPAAKLQPGTEYKITMRKGTMFGDGSSLTSDYEWTFRTEPEFSILGITPRDGSAAVPVDASIEVEFNYKNINAEEFKNYFSITPAIDGKFERHGKKIVFLPSQRLKGGHEYKVVVKDGFQNTRGDKIENSYESTFRVTSEDSSGKYIDQPYMSWGNFSPIISVNRDEVWIGVNQSGLSGNIDFTLYSADKEALVGHLKRLEWEFIDKPTSGDIQMVSEFSRSLSNSQSFRLEFADYGIYLLEASNPGYGRSIYKYLIYTPVGLINTQAKNNSRAWVFNMGEKEPINQANVEFYNLDVSADPLSQATSDSKGYAESEEEDIDLVIAEYSGNYAIANSNSGAGSWMWHVMNYSGYERNYDYRVFIYTDKPLYRPGDTVNYKVIVRKEDDMDYSLPGEKEITVQVGESSYYWNNLKNIPVYEEKFTLSDDFGTATGTFELPKNVDKGNYNISVLYNEKTLGDSYIKITDFVKPKYNLDVQMDKTKAFSSEDITVTVSGEDYSGIPASGKVFNIGIYKSSIDSPYWYENLKGMEDELKYHGGATTVEETNIRLNNLGRASYTVDLSDSDFSGGLGVYTVRIWTSDYESFDSQSVLVAEDNLALFGRSEKNYLQEGSDMEVDFRTVNLWDFEREDGVRLVVNEVVRQWYEWVESGTRYNPATKTTEPVYERVSHSETVLEDEELATDSNGEVQLSFTDLQKGSYTIYTEYGGTGATKVFDDLFTVYDLPDEESEEDDIWLGQYTNFEMYTDKDSYEVGETAYIDIKTTLEGSGVFMVKRGDVYDWKEIDLSQGSISIQQELTQEMAPYTEFCIWGVDEYIVDIDGQGDSEYITDYLARYCTGVNIESSEGKLNVEVGSDKQEYKPGETVKLDIRVTNASGSGVMTEVSVDVIDRALLDLMRSTQDDESPYQIYDAFYETIYQWANAYASMNRYAIYPAAGGGGAGEADVRGNFEDVAYWNGKVYTDSAGRAEVEFTLPDNLTTWDAQVLAITGDETWVGDNSTTFITRKDISLDAKKPQFLYSGDKWMLSLEARNFSDGAAGGSVSLECDGCETKKQEQNINVSPNNIENVRFEVVPKKNADEVTLTSKWQSGDDSYDSVRWDIPVKTEGFEKSVTYSNLLVDGESNSKFDVTIPGGSDKSTADLELTFSRSFVNEWALVAVDPTISSSVDLSSSIIHNSVFCNYYDEIRPEKEKSYYENQIETAVDMLAANQAPQGGFGWFDYDAVNYELSGYVGIALGRAAECGVIEKDDGMIVNLQNYLKNGVEAEQHSLDERILAVYSLAVMDDNEMLPYAIWLKEEHAKDIKDSPLNIAHLTLALQEMDDPGDGAELVKYFEDTANKSDRAATWQSEDEAFRLVNSQAYTTAMVYLAMSPYDHSEYKELARNWLVDNPVDMYGNSQDSVGVFYGLTVGSIDNIEGRKEANKVKVLVNGEEVRTFNVGGDDEWIGKVNLSLDSKYLKDGANKIEVERSGGGDLYVVANLRYYSDVAVSDPDFTVRRVIKDFYTGREVSSVKKGQVVLISSDITVDRDGYNLVVQDFLPSGFEPVRYELGSFDYQFINKWWKWDSNDSVNRYGDVTQSYISFNEYQVKKGSTYSFEYPAVATFGGTFSGGGVNAYFQSFEDVNGFQKTEDISISF